MDRKITKREALEHLRKLEQEFAQSTELITARFEAIQRQLGISQILHIDHDNTAPCPARLKQAARPLLSPPRPSPHTTKAPASSQYSVKSQTKQESGVDTNDACHNSPMAMDVRKIKDTGVQKLPDIVTEKAEGNLQKRPQMKEFWKRFRQKVCSENLWADHEDALMYLKDVALEVFNDSEAYKAIKPSNIASFLTKMRGNIKKTLMSRLDTIVDLKFGDNLEAGCMTILQSCSFVYPDEQKLKPFQTQILAKALHYAYTEHFEDLEWTSYPLPAIALVVALLEFCLARPNNHYATLNNVNRKQYEAALKMLRRLESNNENGLQVVLKTLWDQHTALEVVLAEVKKEKVDGAIVKYGRSGRGWIYVDV
ncbi:hypothetical protein SeLEV6574_g04512 [Synchytrium endobioticum]|uniref:DUF6532 domain-containing protein n=1 Tax=Synchytrium endobioticum TaxID=286115 RepID=A0A507CZ74_9FUNG|nr:hypothetical protein SeLEV6574_g04512 [Synchytrium endobioticum]